LIIYIKRGKILEPYYKLLTEDYLVNLMTIIGTTHYSTVLYVVRGAYCAKRHTNNEQRCCI